MADLEALPGPGLPGQGEGSWWAPPVDPCDGEGPVTAHNGYPRPSRFPFRAGPYIMPPLDVGKTVQDLCYGKVVVAGLTRSPIRWPGFECSRGLHAGLMPIFTAGLVRAVIEEDEVVVAHYWGVTRYMVNKWKCALAGSTDSNVVFTELAVRRADPAFRRKYGFC